MKKLSVLLSAALVMFALSGCQNDIEEGINANNSAEGSSFVLSADIVSTRTTTDAATYKVDWENGDVIYVVTTDGTWGRAYQNGESDDAKAKEFTYNATENVFTTEATIADGTYTFNALYATASQKSYHRGETTTHKLNAEQSMDAEASTATLKENDALAGQFELTTPDEAAGTVAMKHIYTLMQVNVKNTTGADIEVTNFQMTAADADLAGVFTVTFGETPSVAINSGSANTISVDVTNGTVANDASLPIYFVMAPLANYSGDVTFVVTDANANTYTKTISASNLTFAAGTYNTTPYTISTADEKELSVSWDLTSESYASASEDSVEWTSYYVTLTNDKGSSSTNANNYLGGTGTNDHTRVYKDQVMTIAPAEGYEIIRAEFTSPNASYARDLADSEWNNASCVLTGSVVTATPADGTEAMSVTIGAATRFTDITVYYKTAEAKTLESISIEGQTTEFVEGDEFAFGGTVTASYSNGDTADVTAFATVTGYDMSTVGNQTVTVSFTYKEVTKEVSYDITVKDATLASIAVVGQTTAFTIGDTFEFDGTVTATYENGWSETIESGYTVNSDAVNMNTSGTYNVTVNYEGKSTSYEVTVTEAGAATKKTVTYTVTSTSAVSVSGDAPTGASATYSSTYGTKCQLTKGNSMTLTLSGYDGAKITGITMSMKSNSKGGGGSYSMKVGNTTISSISDAKFNTASWNSSWSTSYVDITPAVTATTVGDDETVVITIAATANSLYCQSFTLTYESVDNGGTTPGEGEGEGETGGEGDGEATILLSEEFDNTTNDDSSSAISSSKFSNFSGSTSKAYTSQYGGIKLGTSSAVGYITSKSLDLSSAFTVSIDACKYGSDTGNIVVTVGTQTKTINNSELGAAGTFKTFKLEFDAATTASTIKIATSSKRAYIDNVIVTKN